MVTLTTRQRDIAYQLLNENTVFTAKTFSNYFKVSIRTIRNDLKKISAWINETTDCTYHSEPSKGIWISFASDYAQKNAVDRLCTQNLVYEKEQYYTADERKWKLITKLVFTDQYLTGKELAREIKVSINTFLSDLQNVKKVLAMFHLTLSSKRYYGYSIEGSEINIRNLMEFLLNKRLHQYSASVNKIVEALSSISFEANHDTTIPKQVRMYINKIALILMNNAVKQNENNSVKNLQVIKSMISRLTIIVSRKKDNHVLKQLTTSFNYSNKIHKSIYLDILTLFKINPSDIEFRYFILGGRLYDEFIQTDKLSKEIIYKVSQDSKIKFNQSVTLQDTLTQHLIQKTNLNFQYMSEYTPFTNEVKMRYSELFNDVKKALYRYISDSPVVIDDTDITLVSLHFLTVLGEVNVTRKLKVMYVCSSGLGASQLLQKLIEDKVPELTSVGFASIINYKNRANKYKPDLIISIFPLVNDTNIPIVQVNPIPIPRNIDRIKRVVSKLDRKLLSHQESVIQPNLYSSVSINQVMAVALQATIQLKKYLGNRISSKYIDAFIIHTELAVVRVYFNEQYKFAEVENEIKKFEFEDVTFVKTIFRNLNLRINDSEITALLRYTLLR